MERTNETGFNLISVERIEQVKKHGFDVMKDRQYYSKGQLLQAVKFCETLNKKDWPRGWSAHFRKKIEGKDAIGRLTVRAAFIAAEIDRLKGTEQWKFLIEAEQFTEWEKMVQFVKQKQTDAKYHPFGTIVEQVASIINHYSSDAAKAIADKKDCIEKMKIYLQSMKMLAEGVGMASTYGEKAARLRGMIEVMNATINKLNNDHQDEILSSWSYGLHSHSDFPYRDILQKYEQTKAENEQLKNQLNGTVTAPTNR